MQATATPRWKWNRQNVGYFFVLPSLVLYLIFFVYPFFTSIYLSLTDWDGVQPVMNFVGLQNYERMLDDPMVWQSLKHNLIWVVVGTASPIVLGLLLAMLLWGKMRGRLFFRTVYFMPVVLSSVVIGIIWGWIYNPIFGILNRFLKSVGLGALARGWLGDPNVALYAVLVAAIWSYTGFCVVIFISGLQNVDMDLIDASTVDGANAWQRFINVIIPQLRHVLTMVIAYTLIGGFSVFDIVWIMTNGGPANATDVIATYTYFKSFKQFDMSYGAALSMLMTILALVATIIFMRIRERGEEEAA